MPRQHPDPFPDLERYRIAQLFHELALGGERTSAAAQIARRHGVSAKHVLDFAAEFDPEPLWRL